MGEDRRQGLGNLVSGRGLPRSGEDRFGDAHPRSCPSSRFHGMIAVRGRLQIGLVARPIFRVPAYPLFLIGIGRALWINRSSARIVPYHVAQGSALVARGSNPYVAFVEGEARG